MVIAFWRVFGKRKVKLYQEEYFLPISHVSIVSRNKMNAGGDFVLRKMVIKSISR
jgi:hypothetical protein